MCVRALHALASRQRVGRRKAWHATCPAYFASHAPLAAASFAGAAFCLGYPRASHLLLLTCRHPLLALHHQGQEKTPLVKTSDRLDNPRAYGNKGAHPTPRFRDLSRWYC